MDVGQGLHLPLIAAVDVDYRESGARAACVLFDGWEAEQPRAEHVVDIAEVADYEPGAFFARELPCIRAVLASVGETPELIVVDGYVWLGAGETRPGLGAHLHAALGGAIPVVGVAKNPFLGSTAIEVLRGTSARPLYVTAIGADASQVADLVARMHGDHRIPTLLQRVDHLARGRV